MKMIKAIETSYKGYRFRSRLEARWAVFFDACGIEWQYEPEGFELPSGEWYLPDFRVKSGGYSAWVEVKGGLMTDWEDIYEGGDTCPCPFPGKEKTEEFAYIVMKKGGIVFLFSDIPDPDCKGEIRPQKNMFVTDPSHYYAWNNCCLTLKEVSGDFSWIDYHAGYPFGDYIVDSQKDELSNGLRYRTWWPRDAYEKARSARFEHGELPVWTGFSK